MARTIIFAWSFFGFFTFSFYPIHLRGQETQKSLVSLNLPYSDLGWTEREAAVHVLNRFAFGPLPGEVDQVVQKGVGTWLSEQLNGLEETQFDQQLVEQFPALGMNIKQINYTYPSPAGRLIVAGIKNHMRGYRGGKLIDSLEVNEMLGVAINDVLNISKTDRKDFPGYRLYEEIIKKSGFEDFNSLMYQLMAQKMTRALESKNQLKETMTNFWFNHFNVSITRLNDVGPQVLSYERDAIRPNALGKFKNLLAATAKHPAMLIYLDNDRSNAEEGVATLVPMKESKLSKKIFAGEFKVFAQKPGINENYARELLELHTLGVDGGYNQFDVEELARIFTGWKASPFMFPYAKAILQAAARGLNRKKYYVVKEGFYFDPTRHDAAPKKFLNQRFTYFGGVEEGEQALETLSKHPATARFISQKIARHFTKAQPDSFLIEKMAFTFSQSDGDITKVLKTLMESPEFWDKKNIRKKLKSPFKYITSCARALNLAVKDPIELLRWCTKMGQPLYAYQAPTGYPDQDSHWISGTGLLKRLDFALQLATNQIPGVSYQFDQTLTQAPMIEVLLPEYASTNLQTAIEAIQERERKIGLLLGSPSFQYH